LHLLFFLLLLVVEVAFILLLDRVVWLLRSHVFGDKEILVIIIGRHLSWLVRATSNCLLLLIRHKSHLLVIWWSEDFFILCLSCKLRREDFTFDISIRPDVRDWESNTLVHHFSVQIFTLHVLLPLSGEQLDWVWVREASMALLLSHFSQVTFITLDLIVDKDGGESTLQIVFELLIC
jgi:hypothetical protein